MYEGRTKAEAGIVFGHENMYCFSFLSLHGSLIFVLTAQGNYRRSWARCSLP